MPLTTESALRKDRTTDATLEHRHFAFIAATLADLQPHTGDTPKRNMWADTVHAFADACARTNPRFDRARFLRACNVEG